GLPVGLARDREVEAVLLARLDARARRARRGEAARLEARDDPRAEARVERARVDLDEAGRFHQRSVSRRSSEPETCSRRLTEKYHSIVRRRPSANGTAGVLPRSFRASELSATRL